MYNRFLLLFISLSKKQHSFIANRITHNTRLDATVNYILKNSVLLIYLDGNIRKQDNFNRKTMHIFVIGFSGKTMIFDIMKNMSVIGLKIKIYEREGILIDFQRLICKGQSAWKMHGD